MTQNENLISLRDYFERLIREHEGRHTLEGQAITLLAENLNTRLASMNEFRSQMKDQASLFVTRETVDSRLVSIEERMNRIDLAKARLDGSLAVAVFLIAAATSAVTAFLVKVL